MNIDKIKGHFKNLKRPFFFIISATLFLLGSCCEDCKDGEDGLMGPVGPSPVIIISENDDIQQAIDSIAQENGGTIYLKSGRYELSQGIHINCSNIKISGEPGTLIELNSNVNQPLILIGSDEKIPTVIIENIEIESIELDGNKDYQTSETDPGRPWIRNNCIDIRMACDINIRNVDIHDARSGGLVVSWNSQFIFIDKSSFHHNFFDGIALYASEDIQISNFFCYENNAAGLSLDNELKSVLFNTGIINNNGDVGIFARHSEDLNFNGIVIVNNQSHGCFLSHESVGTSSGVNRLFFNSCSFIDNSGYGFWLASPVSESPNNTVIGCLFSGNTLGPVELDAEGELFQVSNVFQ